MQHLAMIMDGNRRWERSRKLEAVTMGHRKGIDSVKTAIRFCIKNKIKHLSLFAFSIENFRRDEAEKNYIFNWQKFVVPNAAHDLSPIANFAVDLLYQ